MNKKDITIYILGVIAFCIIAPIIMYILKLYWRAAIIIELPFIRWLSVFTMLVGLLFFFISTYYLITRGKGGPAVLGKVKFNGETKHLVTTGPYALCRNPIHLGIIVYYIGFALYINSFSALLIPFLTFIFSYFMAVYVDEPRLRKDFKDEFETWQLNVPRFIPKFKR